MKYKELKKENKRYEKALGVANRTVFEQMEEIGRLNKVNDTYLNTIKKQNVIIEYLESKRD